MINAELLALQCELHGMLAENQNRLNQGKALAYTEESFVELANKARAASDDTRRFEAAKDFLGSFISNNDIWQRTATTDLIAESVNLADLLLIKLKESP